MSEIGHINVGDEVFERAYLKQFTTDRKSLVFGNIEDLLSTAIEISKDIIPYELHHKIRRVFWYI